MTVWKITEFNRTTWTRLAFLPFEPECRSWQDTHPYWYDIEEMQDSDIPSHYKLNTWHYADDTPDEPARDYFTAKPKLSRLQERWT